MYLAHKNYNIQNGTSYIRLLAAKTMRGLRTGSATEWSLPWAALYKFWNTIRNNNSSTETHSLL